MTDLLASIAALKPLLQSEAAEIERSRRLSETVIDALFKARAFSLQLEQRYGGAQADPLMSLRVVEELSRADGSVGWCAMVGSESSACINACLSPDVIEAMLVKTPRAIAALTAVGDGHARVVEGGYLVDGRWRFASGCRHASWLGALCVVYHGETPQLGAQGKPLLRLIFAPAADATFIDTWHTSGLVATASDDFAYTEHFVPAAHTLDLFGPPLDPSPAWLLPPSLRFAMSKAAAVCGIARGTMDHLVPLLQRVPFAGQQAAREEPRVQMKLAAAEAAIEGARAYLYQNVGAAWDHVQGGQPLSLDGVAQVRSAVVFAAQQATRATQLLFELGGTAAVLHADLDRAVRDFRVARQHLQLQDHIVEDLGRVLLGLRPRNPMF